MHSSEPGFGQLSYMVPTAWYQPEGQAVAAGLARAGRVRRGSGGRQGRAADGAWTWFGGGGGMAAATPADAAPSLAAPSAALTGKGRGGGKQQRRPEAVAYGHHRTVFALGARGGEVARGGFAARGPGPCGARNCSEGGWQAGWGAHVRSVARGAARRPACALPSQRTGPAAV